MPGHELAIGSQRRGAEIDNPRVREFGLQGVPALRDAVMAFVEEDEVEEVARQILKPAIFLALELLDVGKHNIGFLKVGKIGRYASDFGGLGIRLALQDAALVVEHIPMGRIEVVVKLLGDFHARGYNEGAHGAEGEGSYRDAARFAAAYGQDNSDLAFRAIRIPGQSGKRGVCLPLRRAKKVVIGD